MNIHSLSAGTMLVSLLLAAMPQVLQGGEKWTPADRQPKPGEIVVLRDVPPRIAYRPAPPGIPVLVDAGPEEEVLGALGVSGGGLALVEGIGELTDHEIAAVVAETGTTVLTQGQGGMDLLTGNEGRSLAGGAGVLGPNGPFAGVLSGGGGGGLVGATVQRATAGIAGTINGALGAVTGPAVR